jgi:hypothetical protein
MNDPADNATALIVVDLVRHPGELLPRIRFLVTNLPFEPEQVLTFIFVLDGNARSDTFNRYWQECASCRDLGDGRVGRQNAKGAY